MKVKLLVSRSGPSGSHSRSDVIDVSDQEAARMIEKGQAIPVRNGAKPETATPRRKYERAVVSRGED